MVLRHLCQGVLSRHTLLSVENLTAPMLRRLVENQWTQTGVDQMMVAFSLSLSLVFF